MIIYRPHRGGLAESMAEAREFESVEAMFGYIAEMHTDPERGPAFMPKDIIIYWQVVDDSRVGWHDTKYVCTKRYFGEVYALPQLVGMCATDYGSLEQSQRMCKEFLEGRQ